MGLDTHFLTGLDTHSCKPWLHVQIFFGGLTHLDLVIPRGAQALHASELFTKFWGPGASHTVRTYGRPSPEPR